MRTVMAALLGILIAVPGMAAGSGVPADEPWRTAITAAVRGLAAGPAETRVSEAVLMLALESAARTLAARSAEEAAALVYAAAIRAEIRFRLGEALPRVRAKLDQELRVAARAGGEAAGQLRALERIWRRSHRHVPAADGTPGWMGPAGARGRWGT